ncbi:MAG TPA: hypothetical protein PKC28_05880 [Bdellovibrionales bacterium]|nr:hypothetical protein [Bdellovibrionales bacterium]
MDEKKELWETVYRTKTTNGQSWTQAKPSPSIDWILEVAPDRERAIIDVGGGTSTLVDYLLAAGFERPAVLDICRLEGFGFGSIVAVSFGSRLGRLRSNVQRQNGCQNRAAWQGFKQGVSCENDCFNDSNHVDYAIRAR